MIVRVEMEFIISVAAIYIIYRLFFAKKRTSQIYKQQLHSSSKSYSYQSTTETSNDIQSSVSTSFDVYRDNGNGSKTDKNPWSPSVGTVSVQKPNQNEMQKGDDGFTSVDVSQANLPERKADIASMSGPIETVSIQISNKSKSDSDDGFASFRIYSGVGLTPSKSSSRTNARWINEGEKLVIKGRQISKGFFYFGSNMNTLTGYGTEPSLIDDKIPVSSPVHLDRTSEIFSDGSLGYWPSYNSLSKECRGIYLDWLASERSNPNMPIGYIFIYFYGLERRVIEHRTKTTLSDNEFTALFDEVSRLYRIYHENRSLRSYSANLLELMQLSRPALFEGGANVIPDTNNSLAFRVNLAKTVIAQQPIDSNLALAWLKNTPEYSLKMPARRCEREFSELFSIRYKEKFNEGITVSPNKTKLKLSYRPASSGIHQVDFDLGDLPDPSILKGPIKKLIPIAELCSDELASYSRYLGKTGVSKDDIAAVMLLPKEIANEANFPVIETFNKWVKSIIQNNAGLTSVAEFWSHMGVPLPQTINKKENDLITNLAATVDVGIAPDPQIHQAKIKSDGNLVLFSPGHSKDYQPSIEFNKVKLAIRLGIMVAGIDGHFDDNEKMVLQKRVEQNEKLTSVEKRSLHAYLIWRLNTPVDNVGLKSKIEQLNTSEIEFVKNAIISVALADGKIEASELKQIEKLYNSLGLDKSRVASDIHQFTSAKPSTSTTNFTPGSENKFTLDDDVLSAHENDTNDAQNLLESIFATEDESSDETVLTAQTGQDGLDQAHKALFDALLKKDKWLRDEVYELCNKLNLMVDGAVETINDWAYEKVDAPVLDDDGDIHVDLEIVEELKG